MKLVIATPLYPPDIGGPATYAKLMEDGLPAHGIDVTLVKFGDVRHLPKIVRHYAYYRRILKAARNADVILALDPVSVGLPAMKAAQALGKPYVVKIVGDYAWEQGRQRFGLTENLDDFVRDTNVPFPVKLLRSVQTRVAKGAAKIIVPSEYLKRVVSAWHVPPEKIAVIYNGIEIPNDLPVCEKHEGEFLIVSAGRRVPWKGFEAIEKVAQKHARWRVRIASGLSRSEALGWMKAADVFVLNSQYEGLSHALIEAMTLGTPVIATDAGGNATLVTDGETGMLIPPLDDGALEKALIGVQLHPEAAHDRARLAQKRMEDFSVPHMLSSTVELLRAL